MIQKAGHRLSDIGPFPQDGLARLRDELSVTTAEEFLDLAARFPAGICRTLAIRDDALAGLVRIVATAVPTAIPPATLTPVRPFATGHDRPPAGHETFERTSGS